MAAQYMRHTGNAIDALDRGDIEIVRRQIKLAQLAARKRIQAKQQGRIVSIVETTVETTVAVERVVDAPLVIAPAPAKPVVLAAINDQLLPAIKRATVPFNNPGTQFYMLLLSWGFASAVLVNTAHDFPTLPTIGSAATSANNSVSGLPVEGRTSSPPGWRIHPISHLRKWHAGTDIAAPTGTPIHATGAGVVMFAGVKGGYGNTVMIDHGNGITTLYGHMHNINVKQGATISNRQVIGTVGSTGASTGPHVHYEKRGSSKATNAGTADPTTYDALILQASADFKIDPLLIKSVIWKESTFNPSASSGKAYGLMQLTPSTGAMMAQRLKMPSPDLYDPATSIRLGTAYLADLQRRFGKLELALAAYNAGPTAVSQHNGIPPYPETQNYVQKILGHYNQLVKNRG